MIWPVTSKDNTLYENKSEPTHKGFRSEVQEADKFAYMYTADTAFSLKAETKGQRLQEGTFALLLFSIKRLPAGPQHFDSF